jgi:hypothetical protein
MQLLATALWPTASMDRLEQPLLGTRKNHIWCYVSCCGASCMHPGTGCTPTGSTQLTSEQLT